MIKCEKGVVEIKGFTPAVLAECSCLLDGVKQFIAKKHGEEFAQEQMQFMLDTAFLDEDSLKKRNEELRNELPPELNKLADVLLDFFGGTDNPGSVEEEA